MAISITPTTTQFIDVLAEDTALNNTGFLDIKSGPATLFGIQINNAHSAPIFVKLYDARAATASSIPSMIIMVINGTIRTIMSTDGIAFASGLSARCVTEPGTPGTTSPGSSCAVRFWLG
jgi:hypothetical protein